jgi:hypothetical protein
MPLTLDGDSANDYETKDRFDDACAEALHVLLQQHPDLKRAIETGAVMQDLANRIFMDVKIHNETLECSLNVEVLIDNQEDGITSTAGQRVTRQTEWEIVDATNVSRMLHAMRWESRRNLIDYLLRADMESALAAKYEQEGSLSASRTVMTNIRELRKSVVNAMN